MTNENEFCECGHKRPETIILDCNLLSATAYLEYWEQRGKLCWDCFCNVPKNQSNIETICPLGETAPDFDVPNQDKEYVLKFVEPQVTIQEDSKEDFKELMGWNEEQFMKKVFVRLKGNKSPNFEDEAILKVETEFLDIRTDYQKGFLAGQKSQKEKILKIFKKFDEYSCIKDDKWYKDLKEETIKNKIEGENK